jgi:hypothetical protein
VTSRQLAEIASAPHPILDPLEVRHFVPRGLYRRYEDGQLDRRGFWRELSRLLGRETLSDEEYFEGRAA